MRRIKGEAWKGAIRRMDCPKCGAKPGEACLNLRNPKIAKSYRVHDERTRAFRKWYRVQRWHTLKRRKPPPKPKKAKPKQVATASIYLKPLLKEIDRQGGHVAKIAWAMNVTRWTVYRWIERWQLWPRVNLARQRRLELPLARVGTDNESASQALYRVTRMGLAGPVGSPSADEPTPSESDDDRA